MTRRDCALSCVALLSLAGCSLVSQSSLPYIQAAPALRALRSTGAGKITHVVYVVQENRSFDDMFQGYPGADTVSSGKNSHGDTIQLAPISLKKGYEMD
ncbi:MAG: hypothetical protein WBE35_17165, partial [Candidatus Cybelea sp.]